VPKRVKAAAASKQIVVDSGPFIALFDRSDRFHSQALGFFKRAGHSSLISNLAVVTEVTHLLDFSFAAQRDFLQWAERALVLDDETVGDWPGILMLLDKYQALPADFADASLVALCERLNCFDVASVDSDFTVYRAQKNKPFRNLFSDEALA